MMGHFQLSESKTVIRLSCHCPPLPRPGALGVQLNPLRCLRLLFIHATSCSAPPGQPSESKRPLANTTPLPIFRHSGVHGFALVQRPPSGFCAPDLPPSNFWPHAGRDVSRFRLEHPVPSASSCCWPVFLPFSPGAQKILGMGVWLDRE